MEGLSGNEWMMLGMFVALAMASTAVAMMVAKESAVRTVIACCCGVVSFAVLALCVDDLKKKTMARGIAQGEASATGRPAELQIGTTYDVVPADHVYLKLKGPDGEERLYEIDEKLLPPSVDRWLLPKLLQRFKYEKREKLVIVPIEAPTQSTEKENK